MSSKPPIVHRPSTVPTFQILFLSEGYRDEAEYRQHVHEIVPAVLHIEPFRQATQSICVWAHFIPSADDSVAEVERDTAFGLAVDADGKLYTRRPQRILDAIREIQVEIPNLIHSLGTFVDGEEVFLGRLTPEESLVCVLAKNPTPSTVTVFEWSEETVEPSPITDDVRELTPCILLSAWALSPDSPTKYANPGTAVALTLARQFGLVFSLASEREEPGAEYETYAEFDELDPDESLEPEWPNVTAYRTLVDDEGRLQMRNLKWASLIPANRRAGGIAELAHPMRPPGATDPDVQALFETAAERAVDSVLMVRHPGLADPAYAGPNELRYVALPEAPLRLAGEANLFEGGHGYRGGLFRPASECLMRFEGYDSGAGAGLTRVGTDFCPVCLEHVRRRLSGLPEMQIHGVRVKPSSEEECSQRYESRLADAMVEHCERTSTLPEYAEYADGSMSCVEATLRRFESLFRDVLGWPLARTVRTPEFLNETLELPYLRGARDGQLHTRRAFNLWITKLAPKYADGKTDDPFALPNWSSRRWAGLGAAGALAYLGFGCIANRRPWASMTRNDRTRRYRDVVNLTDAEFAWLKPGSVLQLWPSRGFYRDIVAFVAGIDDEPSGFGHSLYYVGVRGGQHMVADQHGIGPLSEWDWLPFRIAAQWCDATVSTRR